MPNFTLTKPEQMKPKQKRVLLTPSEKFIRAQKRSGVKFKHHYKLIEFSELETNDETGEISVLYIGLFNGLGELLYKLPKPKPILITREENGVTSTFKIDNEDEVIKIIRQIREWAVNKYLEDSNNKPKGGYVFNM
jgi:hypothetical protein